MLFFFINLYDSHGNQVGDTYDNISNLAPNTKWKFEAPILEDNVSRYEITEQELKLVYAMFYKIRERMQERKYIQENEAVEFSSQELCYWLGIDKKQYHNIKLIINRLMSRVLSIEDLVLIKEMHLLNL